MLNLDEAIRDASGREIAPPQFVIDDRPQGPWDRNHATIKLVCCWCNPPHVMREGIEPASHGACAKGVAIFESGGRA